MTKRQKILTRFLSNPTDFSWNELITLLSGFGFQQASSGKTGGSRVRFLNDNHPPIILHKPHPRPTLKRYQINIIIEFLRQENLI